MKVLVTGGSGYLGTHIRKFFDADDLSRKSDRDILNEDDVRIAAEFDLIIHAAAHLDKSIDGAAETFRVNVEGTRNLLQHVREGAAFVFLSTKDVYGRFADSYQAVPETCPTLYAGQSALEWSKLIAERFVEFYANQRGFRSCIFRLSTTYAPLTDGTVPNFVGHFVDAINKGEQLALPAGGSPVRDCLHVDDLSRACASFESSVIRNGLYNLGGGPRNALSLRELLGKMEEISGYQAVIDEENALPAPVPMRYVSDLSLISTELGWEPEIGLDAGLKTLF
jgi:CDP-paratose 2-epimerase